MRAAMSVGLYGNLIVFFLNIFFRFELEKKNTGGLNLFFFSTERITFFFRRSAPARVRSWPSSRHQGGRRGEGGGGRKRKEEGRITQRTHNFGFDAFATRLFFFCRSGCLAFKI